MKRALRKRALGSKEQKVRKKKVSGRLVLSLLLAVAVSLSLASVSFANGTSFQGKLFKAHLNSLNRSGAEGIAILKKGEDRRL